MTNSKLPNFFIVGAAKSGTSSLYEYLRQHPQVYMSPIKEPNFFAADIDTGRFREDYRKDTWLDLDAYLEGPMDRTVNVAHVTRWDQYVKLYKNVKAERAIGEASTTYLYSGTAALEIKSRIPYARIIMILRNPAERAFSHYLMDLRAGRTRSGFLEYLKMDMSSKEKGWGVSNLSVELGMYSAQVKRYMDAFPAERVKVYLFEELKTDPAGLMSNLVKFLGLDEAAAIDTSKAHNTAKAPRSAFLNHFLKNSWVKDAVKGRVPGFLKDIFYTDGNLPALGREEKEFLKPIYAPDVERLSVLIKKDLSRWVEP